MNTNTNTTNGAKPKTRICENIKRTGTCVYGKNCHFAHDVKELTVSKCAFGQRCVFIQYTEDRVCNSHGTKICKFLHPKETTTDLFQRLEMRPTSPPPPPPSPEPITRINHFPPLAPKKFTPPPTILPIACDITPIRLELEPPKDPDEWVTVRSKKLPISSGVVLPIPIERELKMVATVDAKDLLDSVEKWMESGFTELLLTVKYD